MEEKLLSNAGDVINALIEKLSSKLRIKCKISHELYKIKIIDIIKTLGAYYAI